MRLFLEETPRMADHGFWTYAQRDPLSEFRREAYEMFEELTRSIRG